jgi:heme oxygenase (mycobilin-producing)
MLVKTLIKRRQQAGKAREVFAIIRKIRAWAMNQQGYISGETLIDHDDPQKTLVIGTWQSMEDWLNWKNNPRRNELEEQLTPLLEGPAEIESYVYSKYYLSVASEGN